MGTRVAIAQSQRKYGSPQAQQLQRALRLSAMWSEWLEFTLAPLNVAFAVTGSPGYIYSLLFTLNFTDEGVNLGLALVCGSIIAILHRWKQYGEILERLVYPVAFDLLYIPITATFLRLGTCPMRLEHLELLNSFTCDCVNHFGIFWGVGLLCFALHYCGALHHKMVLEPLATTVDFRFPPKYQFLIVVARSVGPMAALLVMNVGAGRDGVLAVLCCMLFISWYLLAYSYNLQPCIGSGRGPNNIRVVTFASSLYTTLCSIGIVATSGTLYTLLLTLAPLPLVWTQAWRTNSRRATKFHIPNVPIMQLLLHSSSMISTVGAVAALHVSPSNVVERHHERIMWMSERLTSEAVAVEYQRLYTVALRVLKQTIENDDRDGMRESALFLLQWYRTGYLHLAPEAYLQVLAALCASGDVKIVIDATHSLHEATTATVLSLNLWLEHLMPLQAFVNALDAPSATTVGKCATVLAMVVEAAKADRRRSPLFGEAIRKVEIVMQRWRACYIISDALERVYATVAAMEPSRQRRRGGIPNIVKESVTQRTSIASVTETAALSSFSNSIKPPRKTQVAPVGPHSALIDNSKLVGTSQAKPAMPQRIFDGLGWLMGRPLYTNLARAVLGTKETGTTASGIDVSVLAAVVRRRERRRQFADTLARAYECYVNAKCRNSSRRRSKCYGFQDIIEEVLERYHAPDECAIHDYVATAVDADVRAFFVPYLSRVRQHRPR
ncbi:hypothetical protein ACHHYP_14769 [Achlya hypogyna]|uniref:Transmembrane protein n=1 Tax=Achlya hypogyna TaxID=1202772 RepID=A0A1V9YCG5_ACHHY|nr:hypothetical protein ACHHYP_14769 [Achlya hypogyna]